MNKLEPGPAGSQGKAKNMEKLTQNIQEAFLNHARREKIFLTIYLMSGVKLSGRIKSFDKYSLVLETNNQEQLIFKHAVSTVVVSKSHSGPPHSGPPHSGPPHSSAGAASGSGTSLGPRPQPLADRKPEP